MNNLFSSIVLGLLFIVIFYLLCLFLVVGVKMVYLNLKSKFFTPIKPISQTKQQTTPPAKRQSTSVKKPRAVRSIEINPDDVDRIYVRKSS